ncbi:MAG: hypothetical protein QXY85_08505 [Candidatus Nitrosocaldus sp.]
MAKGKLSQRNIYTEGLEDALTAINYWVLEPLEALGAMLRQLNLSYVPDEFVSCLGRILEAIAEKGYNELDSTLPPSLKEETLCEGENGT